MVIYLLKNEVLQSKFQVITKNKGNPLRNQEREFTFLSI